MMKDDTLAAWWCMKAMRVTDFVAGGLLALCAAGCRTGRNYLGVNEPRYAGNASGTPSRSAQSADSLRIVSFNVAFGRHVDRAIALFGADTALRHADIVFLQEMDADGTRRMASALGMQYVFYPAIFHKRTKRDFGNAVLSRFPIVDDAKLVLPHRSWYAGTQRIATAATIRVGDSLVRVYSTHLSTILDMRGAGRRDQLRAILADARPFARVVIGGDMNSSSVGAVAREAGFAWPTQHGPSTTRGGRWDHLFFKGLSLPDSGATGTPADPLGVSDHLPVWAIAIVR